MKARQGGLDRLFGAHLLVHQRRDQMRDHFGVGFRGENPALGHEFVAQFAEILDDSVVNDREPRRGMRVGVVFGRLAMRGPARMADAAMARKRSLAQLGIEVLELALGAHAADLTVLEHGHAG